MELLQLRPGDCFAGLVLFVQRKSFWTWKHACFGLPSNIAYFNSMQFQWKSTRCLRDWIVLLFYPRRLSLPLWMLPRYPRFFKDYKPHRARIQLLWIPQRLWNLGLLTAMSKLRTLTMLKRPVWWHWRLHIRVCISSRTIKDIIPLRYRRL